MGIHVLVYPFAIRPIYIHPSDRYRVDGSAHAGDGTRCSCGSHGCYSRDSHQAGFEGAGRANVGPVSTRQIFRLYLLLTTSAYWQNFVSALALLPAIAVSGELGGIMRMISGEEGSLSAFLIGSGLTVSLTHPPLSSEDCFC
jgi:hypothetical protein